MSQDQVQGTVQPRVDYSHSRSQPRSDYLRTVWRRQRNFIAMLFAVLVPVAVLMAWLQSTEFSSTVTAFYDDRGSFEGANRDPMFPRFGQVAEAFKTRLADSDFLWQVAQEVGLPARHINPPFWQAKLAEFIPPLSRLITPPQQVPPNDEISLRAEVVHELKDAMRFSVDDRKNLLQITAHARDPVHARQLADTLMEEFIQSQLRFEAEAYRRQHELFASYLHDVSRTMEADIKSAEEKKTTETTAVRTEQDVLRDQEAEIIDKIQLVKAEIDQDKARVASSRASLEAELARLITRLQPSHPDVIAKQEELRALGRGLDDRVLRSRLVGLRQQLTDIRAAQRKLGMKVEIGEGREDELGLRGGVFVPNLSDRVNELNLQEMDVSRQAESPALRTRLRTVLPASFDLSSERRRLRQLFAVFLAIAGVFALAAGVLREATSPFVRDAWRAELASGVPVIGEISREQLRRRDLLVPSNPSDSPSGDFIYAGGGDSRDGALPYRLVVGALQKLLHGRTILLLDTALSDDLNRFHINLMNVQATDTAGATLLFDCNQTRSLADELREAAPGGKLSDFLAGKIAWKDVRLSRTPNRGFDLVLADDRTVGPYTSEQLSRFFAALSKNYGYIFVRGREPEQVVVNNGLSYEASDLFLVIDAARTTFKGLRALINATDVSRLRGLILIGT